MLSNTMVVVVPVDKTDKNESDVCLEVWTKVTQLLRPRLGKLYSGFAPSLGAWSQPLRNPLGVVLGKTDPALFMYFFASAKTMQEQAIHHHIEGLLEGITPVSKTENERLTMCVLDASAHDGAAGEHLRWHFFILRGVPLPDCGIYFLEEKEAFAATELEQKVLSDLGRYALCVVTLTMEETGHASI